MSRNQKLIKKKLSYGALGISRLQISDFPSSILAACLRSVIAPKQVDRFLCGWWHSLAFLKLYMTHVKKSKIDQKKSRVMGWNRNAFFVCRLKKSAFPTPILATCLKSVIAPKRVDRFLCGWWHSLEFLKFYMIHVKKSKIDQEKAKLWGKREMRFLCAASRSLIFPFQFWPVVFEVS